MKENYYIQVNENQSDISNLKVAAKSAWKDAGNKVKDIKTIDYYVKPNDNKCYYMINQDFSGDIDLF